MFSDAWRGDVDYTRERILNVQSNQICADQNANVESTPGDVICNHVI